MKLTTLADDQGFTKLAMTLLTYKIGKHKIPIQETEEIRFRLEVISSNNVENEIKN